MKSALTLKTHCDGEDVSNLDGWTLKEEKRLNHDAETLKEEI